MKLQQSHRRFIPAPGFVRALAGLVAALALLATTLAAGAAVAPDSSERFLRFQPDEQGGGFLETSIVRYENPQGVQVDLIGVVHVADRAYYDLLNERFAKYDSLLYEMVMPRGADPAAPRDGGGGGMGMISMLQRAMQTVLELDYQIDAIDYSAENFVHADMDLQTFLRRQRERGEGFLDMFLRQMLDDLTRPADRRQQPQVSMMELMEALGAPDRARRLKMIFAQELSRMDDLLKIMDGPDGSVILTERNEKAVEVMDERIEAGDRKLGIFYGAAHLKGLEELLQQRGFEQVGEPEYLVAWDMTHDGRGRAQMRQMMRDTIVRQAVEEGEAHPAGAEAGRPEAGRPEAGRDDRGALVSELSGLRRELEAIRGELEALREQNEALREQVRVLREQNERLRREADGE